MIDSIFIWHHFEQQEAAIFDKLISMNTKRKCFVEMNKLIDISQGHGLVSEKNIEWMTDRVGEIAGLFPELILDSNE